MILQPQPIFCPRRCRFVSILFSFLLSFVVDIRNICCHSLSAQGSVGATANLDRHDTVIIVARVHSRDCICRCVGGCHSLGRLTESGTCLLQLPDLGFALLLLPLQIWHSFFLLCAGCYLLLELAPASLFFPRALPLCYLLSAVAHHGACGRPRR